MSHLYVNYPPQWNQNELRITESFTKNLSLKVDSPPHPLHLNAHLGFNFQEQDPSSSQSTQSNHDNMTANNAATNSQDQCMSSESGQEVSCGKNLSQVKPIYLMGHPEASYSTGQVDYGRTMTCMPYPSGDPYYGLLTAYATSPIIQPHMMGMTSPRVPLPLDISEDEPIYVNAKQYHGILRRRQSRAKMEAQNKLIKIRKPYLHESRHLHALNRVRGSGGRFLSTKKQQQSDSNFNGNHTISGSNNAFVRNGNNDMVFEPLQSHVSDDSGFFHQSEIGFLGISSHSGGAMQRDGRLMNNLKQRVVR